MMMPYDALCNVTYELEAVFTNTWTTSYAVDLAALVTTRAY